MIRPILAAAALVALTATAGISQSMDCDKSYQEALGSVAKMNASGGKRVALARMMARGYDYCMAGMTVDAKKIWEMAADRQR